MSETHLTNWAVPFYSKYVYGILIQITPFSLFYNLFEKKEIKGLEIYIGILLHFLSNIHELNIIDFLSSENLSPLRLYLSLDCSEEYSYGVSTVMLLQLFANSPTRNFTSYSIHPYSYKH